MSRPLHETLRAFGQGLVLGTAVTVPLVLAIVYLGPVVLALAAPTAGAALITVANALKRREQRQAGGAR